MKHLRLVMLLIAACAVACDSQAEYEMESHRAICARLNADIAYLEGQQDPYARWLLERRKAKYEGHLCVAP